MPHIFLYGPSGTGKSAIGKVLAKNLGLPFVDLDSVIEANAGISIPQIMEQQGESSSPRFGNCRVEIFSPSPYGRGVRGEGLCYRLGGGALLREENRLFAETHGTVILLMAQRETLLARLEADTIKRPLLVCG